VYIDNIGVFSNEWSNHLASLSKILALLKRNNLMINPLKCEWCVKETDWLGYWLTPTGLKPWKQKIQVILALEKTYLLNPHCRTLHCLGPRAARTCKPAHRHTVTSARQQRQPCCHAHAGWQSPLQQACRVIPFLACSLVLQHSCLLAERAKKI
jgi:hypothetical protein